MEDKKRIQKIKREDKRYFRKEEELFERVQKAVKEKDKDWLGKFLQKFSIEGDFWGKENKKDDWL